MSNRIDITLELEKRVLSRLNAQYVYIAPVSLNDLNSVSQSAFTRVYFYHI